MTDCHKYCDQPEKKAQAPQRMLAVLAQQRITRNPEVTSVNVF
jgi:hypothetical protein